VTCNWVNTGQGWVAFCIGAYPAGYYACTASGPNCYVGGAGCNAGG
jgi:hypothetical protein